MQTTLDPTSETLAAAKSHVADSSARLVRILSFVPDDRLTSAPSSTSRSALGIVAHCALSNAFFAKIITGTLPEPMPTPENFFRDLRAAEAEFATREAALERLERNTAELCAAIGSVDAPDLDASPVSPFGALPMRFWIGEAGAHLDYHVGQLAYLQTTWGDLDDHMG